MLIYHKVYLLRVEILESVKRERAEVVKAAYTLKY